MSNRTRSRIGVSVAPDVMDILNEHGRREGTCGFRPDKLDAHACSRCGTPQLLHSNKPTRTEIIERAVREWAERHGVLLSGGGRVLAEGAAVRVRSTDRSMTRARKEAGERK